MKKFITIVASVIALSAFAQTGHQVKSFINDKIASLVVSNAAGTVIVPGLTNLNSTLTVGLNGAGTNAPGTTWTNKDGSYVILSAANMGTATNDQASVPLFKDVDLFPDRMASAYPIIDNLGYGASNLLANFTITLRAVGRSGKSGTLLFRFCPLYDGTNESTISGQVIPVALTINSTTPVVLTTNIPLNKVIGAKRLRLRELSSGDTGAGTDAFVTDIDLSGFVP